jgi:hypothetical protein
MGGRRHLREVALPDGVRTVALRDDPLRRSRASPTSPATSWCSPPAIPGFFGVVRAVRRAVAPRRVDVLPG